MKKKESGGKKISFVTTIHKFEKKGEKTGWTYIEIPADLSDKINPGIRKSYRVKGKLDSYEISRVAILPMGDGNFIMPLNEAMRKAIGKRNGAMLKVSLQADEKKPEMNTDLLACLAGEPKALDFFNSLSPSHQSYFSKWIDSAKTEDTRANRIARSINALLRRMNYGEMLREKIF